MVIDRRCNTSSRFGGASLENQLDVSQLRIDDVDSTWHSQWVRDDSDISETSLLNLPQCPSTAEGYEEGL